jgi:hypothetical protein
VFLSSLQGSTKAVNAPTTSLPAPGDFNVNPASISLPEDAGSLAITVTRDDGWVCPIFRAAVNSLVH